MKIILGDLKELHTPTLKKLCEMIIESAPPQTNTNNQKPKHKWFDKECELARKLSFKKLEIWREETNWILKNLRKKEYARINKEYTAIY